MPDYLSVEPDQLRAIAAQHDEWAKSLHKWGEIPSGWLKRFQGQYGTIADPVRTELETYYNKRHDKAEFLARKHERTRDELLATAAALEDGDHAGGGDIKRAGGAAGIVPTGSPHANPADTGRDTPVRQVHTPGHENDAATRRPSLAGPEGHAPVDTDQHLGVVNPSAAVPAGGQAYNGTQSMTIAPRGDVAPVGAVVPSGNAPDGIPVPPISEAGRSASQFDAIGSPPADASGIGGSPPPLGMMPGPSTPGPGVAASAVGPGTTQTGATSVAPSALAAAISAAKSRQTMPLAREQVNEDLVIARTLLAAVLAAAARSAPDLEWAVAVSRNPVNPSWPIISLTSNEGRGWLPPGLFLPSEVMVPWEEDSILEPAERRAVAALEGSADPARMLTEIGLRVARQINIRITALASSTAIAGDIRIALGQGVGLADRVSPTEATVDLTAPGPGLVDRLETLGSHDLRHQAVMISESEIRDECLQLARAADLRIRAVVPVVGEAHATLRASRERILGALSAGQPVPASWWDQLRAADGQVAAALRSGRIQLSGVPIGGSVEPRAAEKLRNLIFERRAGELLLLLEARRADRPMLREALYNYGQIFEHPFLSTAMPAVTAEAIATDAAAIPRSGGSSYIGSSPRGVGVTAPNSGNAPATFFAESLNGPSGPAGFHDEGRR